MKQSNHRSGITGVCNPGRSGVWVVAALLLALIPVASHAQGTGRSMDFDTHVGATGMGGACVGVAWGEPDVWGNVASLSRVSGVRWEHSSTQLVPGLATDVWLRSNRLLVGARGVGVSLLGVPAVLDGVRLDYGTSEATNVNGDVTGTFSSYETVNGQALAVSLPQILDAMAFSPGGATHFSDACDLSLGLARKRTHVQLAPKSMSGTAEATAYDLGVQARFSPLWLLPAPADAGSLKPRDLLLLDLGLGYGALNAMGGKFAFRSDDQSSPATRMRRTGYAVRLGVRMPRPDASGAIAGQVGPLALLLEGFDPLMAWVIARDHEVDVDTPAYEVHHQGYEITIANVYTLRRGHWTDRLGDIDGPTSGWGLGIPVGPWGGFRYDKGTMPQAEDSGLPDVTREGWTVWCDAVRVWRDLHAGSGGAAHAR